MMYHRPTPVPFYASKHREQTEMDLELILQADGTAVYVTPSHLQTLEYFASQISGQSVEALSKQCPPEMYADYDRWLMWQTGCICVWDDFIKGAPNPQQADALTVLHNMGLYRGQPMTPAYLEAVHAHEDRQRALFAPVKLFPQLDPAVQGDAGWFRK